MRFIFRVIGSLAMVLMQFSAQGQVLVRGDSEAPLKLVVFSAYSCPYCQETRGQLEALQQKFSNQIQVIVKNFPLGSEVTDFLPHEVALSAQAQGQFKRIYDAIFDLAPEAKTDRVALFKVARKAGLDVSKIEDDLGAGRWRQRIADEVAEASAFGVSGVPTIFIDGFKLEGLQSQEALEQIVAYRLERITAARSAPSPDNRVAPGANLLSRQLGEWLKGAAVAQ